MKEFPNDLTKLSLCYHIFSAVTDWQRPQLTGGVGAVLRHHHTTLPAAAPGGQQECGPHGWQPTEEGGAPAEEQRQVPRHRHRLPSDTGLWCVLYLPCLDCVMSVIF